MATDEPISPAWSHELATIAQSPLWVGARGQQAKDIFMDEAERYGSYDELPARLQRVYQRAARQLSGQRGTDGH